MKNKAQQLREIRNKHFPPQLEFGCEVEVFDRELQEQVFNELVWKLVVVDDRYLILKPFRNEYIDTDMQKIDIKYIDKILGKPTDWGEILMILNKSIDKEKYLAINTSGCLYNYVNDELISIIQLDLTRSPEEQDDLVLNIIIKLLTSNPKQ